MAPHGNCLQYHTASSGTFASFAWDLSTYGPGVASGTGITEYSQFHLANQHYDVCFRREQGKTSICYTPKILGSSSGSISSSASYGLGGSAKSSANLQETDGVRMWGSTGVVSAAIVTGTSACQGFTQFSAIAVAIGGTKDTARTTGDYLEIPQAFDLTASGTLPAGVSTSKITRVCGNVFAVAAIASAVPLTICSKTTPFRVGLKTDSMENIGLASNTQAQLPASASNWDNFNTGIARSANEGLGYSGFYLEYFQV